MKISIKSVKIRSFPMKTTMYDFFHENENILRKCEFLGLLVCLDHVYTHKGSNNGHCNMHTNTPGLREVKLVMVTACQKFYFKITKNCPSTLCPSAQSNNCCHPWVHFKFLEISIIQLIHVLKIWISNNNLFF